MLQINVALPSGKRKQLAILESSKVGDLIVLAQESFGQGFRLRLVTAEGHVLSDHVKSLQAAGIEDGDHITAISQQKAQLAATGGAAQLFGAAEVTQLSRGALKILVATFLQCKISSGVCSKFRPHIRHLLQSCRMDPWLLGDIQFWVVTAPQFKIS